MIKCIDTISYRGLVRAVLRCDVQNGLRCDVQNGGGEAYEKEGMTSFSGSDLDLMLMKLNLGKTVSISMTCGANIGPHI